MADDQEVRLEAILRWLHQGKLTTSQAADKVRTLRFPVPDQPSLAERFAEHHRADVALPQHGSFAVISAAYASGQLDRKQYTALAEAAREAMSSTSLSADGNYTGFGKVSHELAGYGDDKGTAAEHCGNCYMYDDQTGLCTLVADIKPGGRCERWLPDVPA